MEDGSVATVGRPRDEYEIKEDLRAVKRAMTIFKDKERLKDVQDLIKKDKATQTSLDFVANGDLQKALGFS